MPVQKPYHHGDLRAAILKASLDLLRETGTREFTLREVARRAGVSHMAPYRHFRDRAELLAAVAEDGFHRLTAAMRAGADRAKSPFGRLQNAGIAYVEFAHDHREHFSIMFTVELNESFYPSAREAAEGCYAELVTLVGACQPGLLANDQRLEMSARIAWTQVHGIAELALRGQLGFRNRQELRSFAKLATSAVGRGLGLTA